MIARRRLIVARRAYCAGFIAVLLSLWLELSDHIIIAGI